MKISKDFFNFKAQKSRWLFCALLLGLCVSYGYFLQSTKRLNYQAFDLKGNYSWQQSYNGIYRLDAKGDLDAITLSQDQFKDFEFFLNLINPRDCAVLFNYQDRENYHFIYFDKPGEKILLGLLEKGRTHVLAKSDMADTATLLSLLQVRDHIIKFFINQKLVLQFDLKNGPAQETLLQGGRIGLMLKSAGPPKTIFHNLILKGHTVKGQWVESPAKDTAGLAREQQLSVVVLFTFMVVLAFYLYGAMLKFAPRAFGGFKEKEREQLSFFTVAGVHFLLTVFIFWPFIFRKEILVSSADNLGEIYPLFIYSKHIFADILAGRSLSLWNPFAHNGIPFFSNHWNMVYYPLNWIIFLFNDKDVLPALTARTFLEVFGLGVCAYGFFSRELPSRTWALFSSIIYQLSSLLIFTLIIFPSVSFFFSSTLYLSLLWSIPQRKDVWNYILLTFAVILIFTSANMAFIFYGGLALAIFTIYRVGSLAAGKERRQAVRLGALSLLTAVLVSAVRIIPCVAGVVDSNRIVENFYTLHDRFFLLTRLAVPEIVGWLGAKSFNALTSPNLNLVFEQSDLPSNSQNTFFVYFGILAALLLVFNIFITAQGRHAFWKRYTFLTLALALMFQPFWGIFNILLFPFNHYSYYIIILPVGMCALLGFTGHYLETKNFRIFYVMPKLYWALGLLQLYILVIFTYLFPGIAKFSKGAILAGVIGWAAASLAKKKNPNSQKLYFRIIAFSVIALCWVGLFVIGSAILMYPIEAKETVFSHVLLPALGMLSVIALAIGAYANGAEAGFWKKRIIVVTLPAVLVLLIILKLMSSSIFAALAGLGEGIRNYILDISLAEIKFILIALSGVTLLMLYKVKLVSRDFLWFSFVLITLLDLVGFNARFDNVAAPSPQRQAFYPTSFPYKNIERSLSEKLDLINYRVHALHKAGLNANENLIYRIPGYAGIMGHMPKRFSKFIINFGYPKQTVLIYPEEKSENDRFLDLSAVKYEFLSEGEVKERPSALARLMMFYDYAVVRDDTQMLEKIKDPSFKPREKVLISQDPLNIPSKANKPAEFVRIAGDSMQSSDRIIAEVKNSEDGILLFSESYAQGWMAFVDNQEVPVILANYAFMAAPVKAGTHIVEFRFEPRLFFQARQVSLMGIIFFLVTAAYLFVTGKKARP